MRRPRVRFLYTGGTLGMLRGAPGPLAPSHVAEDVVPFVRGLEEEVNVEGELLFNLDSSDIGPGHWEHIAAVIAAERLEYDGFVVLHGTDTMAYTASALSFLLRGLDRAVVVTGAQRPIAFVRTDARANLIHSALCAAMPIPEVCVYFGRWLFRGNRTTKVNIQSYEAIESPNLPPLLEMGVECVPQERPLHPTGPFTLQAGFCEQVANIEVVPGSGPWLLDAAVARGARGVLLHGFGAGNVPRSDWPGGIRAAVDAGVAVALASQCLHGSVNLTAYEGGRAAMDAGAMSTGAMTTEAALVKLMFLLGQGLTGEALRDAYTTPLAGEG